ncbi:SDR family oxidoreductase [Acidocella aminolytica]|jgi:NAD(P)-dependent dehydrogenase (short-subunit alcohol dehydrogenase family)|uniref:Oxidoreductase/SDR, gluconate 5-dehydrogenase n=1 Tax=Acidocella aminolytica 101 = DSM 11237 TaxID=1120923 RepID=A0A0D6PI69_9PROT|nr:SDR family oxidoreductase [Acidocella aminolytica]GAN81352.1 oxidoreductase/SDR, gluconate 5-dehydrogenase [Acidocella aminolytica 101 = DSM 11237]GBQ33609.1 dehydrogenase [Acidocella aminolytica 101 = DSM 11237]SHF42774.1 NAD(P)-dependent dehydrogenase, short-chain alcohol dehydrogenase family [Acidocella aminolytica 101 = DSM 11237]
MPFDFSGKTVLVTGGSKGIGFACAKAFLETGARVAICSRAQANIDTALTNLPGVTGFTADLCDAAQAAALLDQVETALGTLDILVNSAGAAKRTPPEDLIPAAWRAAMDAKYFSTINILDPAIKRMVARGQGAIVNIIGMGGKVAAPVHIAGGAANAALMLATVGLAAAYAKSGVRINGINPGLTETGRVQEGMRATAKAAGITVEEAMTDSVANIRAGRFAKPEEIASTVLFLASPLASYINGAILPMDGVQNPVI